MRNISKCVIAVLFISLLAFCLPEDGANAEKRTPVKIKVGKTSFNGVFYNNDTAKALLKKMPVKYKMSELNGNEKYKYLSKDLPSNEKKIKKIKAGDIMLYGSDCLVVFYKSFKTSYDYTPIGRITNTKGLKKAAGKGSVTIKFSKKKVIELSYKKLTLNPGKTKTIKLKGASAKKVRWTTSNKKTATVKKGKIKAKKVGKATITAKYKGKKYKCQVTVKNAEKSSQNEGTKSKSDNKQAANDGTNDNYIKTDDENGEQKDEQKSERKMEMLIGDKKVNVKWEDNESVAALKELADKAPVTISMSMYGGFEQVGSIGQTLPSNDVQMKTSPGDIVLYSSNQIVIFYGSNSWAYTKLGHITDQDEEGMKALLGSKDVNITIKMEETN